MTRFWALIAWTCLLQGLAYTLLLHTALLRAH